ncbi:ATP-grasp domain-containing protein [Psychrobacter sanguinis]|uniref:ATP-grasp domain-containing protein n=1 Tax=Psychrobacter sanguinis TaxID=861445 RepID=UPI00191A5CD9|nr:hypothetical protein [Psychrobacter sanguinis]MCC3308769.1 hypothetical protein [Psychrobacter sanguinis]UEC26059.1 hypothetical protein LK453_02665 [Psychrobacter sanguinis]
MKIAIHHREGSFSERWLQYCIKNNISYKIVNAFDNDIIHQVKDCDIFMWHHHHGKFKDVLTAKRILFALEQAGIIVFPNFNTGWHFDDKVAQKYLLEAIGAPLVPSYVFYEQAEALAWAKQTSFPKVFKLKGGAGAKNVKLVRSYKEAKKIIHQAFNKGFAQFDKLGNLKERFNKFKAGQDSLIGVLKGAGRLVVTPEFSRLQNNENGYVYFQDFIPNNKSDTRVIIINRKAFAIKRMVRTGDFRASGSGNIIYDIDSINIKTIELAFSVNEILRSQCVAFDFVLDDDGNPLIVEISYGFSIEAYDQCPGYWDENLNWYTKKFNPQYWMIESLLSHSHIESDTNS